MIIAVFLSIGFLIWVLREKRRSETERDERFADAIFRLHKGENHE
jgi:hypothetical protein